jgi:hypothetical protein
MGAGRVGERSLGAFRTPGNAMNVYSPPWLSARAPYAPIWRFLQRLLKRINLPLLRLMTDGFCCEAEWSLSFRVSGLQADATFPMRANIAEHLDRLLIPRPVALPAVPLSSNDRCASTALVCANSTLANRDEFDGRVIGARGAYSRACCWQGCDATYQGDQPANWRHLLVFWSARPVRAFADIRPRRGIGMACCVRSTPQSWERY